MPVLASLSVVRSPSTNVPIPVASTAAATGPVGRSISWSALVSKVSLMDAPLRDRRGLRDQGAEQAGDRRGHERADEDDEDEQPRGAVAGERRAVVVDEEGCEGGEHRRGPGDVLLPFHAELVPVLGVAGGVREQEVARGALGSRYLCALAAGAILAGERLAVPGVDYPSSGDHGRPGGNRHRGGAELEPAQALADPGGSDVLGAQAPEAGEPAGEGEQEERAQDQPGDQRPRLATRELHSVLSVEVTAILSRSRVDGQSVGRRSLRVADLEQAHLSEVDMREGVRDEGVETGLVDLDVEHTAAAGRDLHGLHAALRSAGDVGVRPGARSEE